MNPTTQPITSVIGIDVSNAFIKMARHKEKNDNRTQTPPKIQYLLNVILFWKIML
jgi:hypothetical protein